MKPGEKMINPEGGVQVIVTDHTTTFESLMPTDHFCRAEDYPPEMVFVKIINGLVVEENRDPRNAIQIYPPKKNNNEHPFWSFKGPEPVKKVYLESVKIRFE